MANRRSIYSSGDMPKVDVTLPPSSIEAVPSPEPAKPPDCSEVQVFPPPESFTSETDCRNDFHLFTDDQILVETTLKSLADDQIKWFRQHYRLSSADREVLHAEIWGQGFIALQALDPKREPEPYLKKVMRHHGINYLRTEMRHANRIRRKQGAAATMTATQKTPCVERLDDQDQIAWARSQMTDEQWALSLDYANFGPGETARIWNMNRSTVHRRIDAIRAMFHPPDSDPDEPDATSEPSAV